MLIRYGKGGPGNVIGCSIAQGCQRTAFIFGLALNIRKLQSLEATKILLCLLFLNMVSANSLRYLPRVLTRSNARPFSSASIRRTNSCSFLREHQHGRLSIFASRPRISRPSTASRPATSSLTVQSRTFVELKPNGGKTEADLVVEELQELYESYLFFSFLYTITNITGLDIMMQKTNSKSPSIAQIVPRSTPPGIGTRRENTSTNCSMFTRLIHIQKMGLPLIPRIPQSN